MLAPEEKSFREMLYRSAKEFSKEHRSSNGVYSNQPSPPPNVPKTTGNLIIDVIVLTSYTLSELAEMLSIDENELNTFNTKLLTKRTIKQLKGLKYAGKAFYRTRGAKGVRRWLEYPENPEMQTQPIKLLQTELSGKALINRVNATIY